MKVFAVIGKKRMNLHRIFDLNFADKLSNILVHSLRMYQVFAVCRTYCTGHRHRPLSQHGLTEAILGESVFAIDLASISYIGREESITGHGSSPPSLFTYKVNLAKEAPSQHLVARCFLYS